jgi:hypothetical protein
MNGTSEGQKVRPKAHNYAKHEAGLFFRYCTEDLARGTTHNSCLEAQHVIITEAKNISDASALRAVVY